VTDAGGDPAKPSGVLGSAAAYGGGATKVAASGAPECAGTNALLPGATGGPAPPATGGPVLTATRGPLGTAAADCCGSVALVTSAGWSGAPVAVYTCSTLSPRKWPGGCRIDARNYCRLPTRAQSARTRCEPFLVQACYFSCKHATSRASMLLLVQACYFSSKHATSRPSMLLGTSDPASCMQM
jgi:hypothetical protein